VKTESFLILLLLARDLPYLFQAKKTLQKKESCIHLETVQMEFLGMETLWVMQLQSELNSFHLQKVWKFY